METKDILSLIKWFIGTVVLGLVGIFINKKIQETNLELKELETDKQLISTITKDITKHIENDLASYKYLKFVRTFITSETLLFPIEEKIGELEEAAERELRSVTQTINNTKQEKAKKQFTKKEQLKVENEVSKLKKDEVGPVNIEKLQSIEDQVAKFSTKIDSSTISEIEKVQKAITPVVISKEKKTYILEENPMTKWCKEDYYVKFYDVLKIVVKSKVKKGDPVEIKIEDLSNKEKTKEYVLEVGKSVDIKMNEIRYQVKLTFIGGAGKNPLTKAAYFTVSQYVLKK